MEHSVSGEVLINGLPEAEVHQLTGPWTYLAQIVVGFAVTRTGIPVRCWVWPGNTVDQNVVEEVKRDLSGWRLGWVVMVADTGFNSGINRRVLQGAGGHYILGEKLRLGSKGLPAEALSRAGSYRSLDNGLEIREVVVDGDSEACRRRGMTRTQFYEYKRRFQTHGLEGLKDLPPIHKTHPQTTPPEVEAEILALSLEHPG